MAATVVFGGAFTTLVSWRYLSPWHIEVGYQPEQPVFYSHKLHAGVMGMDCRYCHQHVERGPHATVPTTETCMNCHGKVKTGSVEIQKIAEAHAADKPIEWVKVHMLPDYAYFNHSAHVNAGVGCASCHGRVDQMEVVRQTQPLSMGWCLDCHREPENHLRPRDKVTDMDFVPDPEAGKKIKKDRQLSPPTHCSACHQ